MYNPFKKFIPNNKFIYIYSSFLNKKKKKIK